ncbi:sugar transferase [Brachybacterium sp. GCM10030252]|uniref:sugar transferase n=1 Tax=Brachybacterium sp. GCM10030252 TaxID=3273380 RepID=UPI003608F835
MSTIQSALPSHPVLPWPILTSPLRRRGLAALIAAGLTAGILAVVGTEPLVLGAGAAWFVLALATHAFDIRRGERHRSAPLLVATAFTLAALAAHSALWGQAVRGDVAVLLLALTLAHWASTPLVRLVLDRTVPPRAIIVCPAAEIVRHRHGRSQRVRGFSAETLQDPGVVVAAVLHDVARGGADRVELLPGIPDRTVQQLAWALRRDGVELLLHQPTGRVRSSRTELLMTAHGPGLLLTPPRPGLLTRVGKRALDVLGAAALLVLLGPVLLGTALAVRREDGGPALYRQERIGLDGKPFQIYKFRTMVQDADAQLEALLREQNADGRPLFKVSADPRVTRLGAFLRRSSIDELPQLLNVLEGTMSLVGPRPQRPAEVALYDGDAEHRLGVRPGMTGLWQVSGRSRLSWEQARELDVYYAHNWSPLLDLTILLRTFKAVLTSDGAV